MHKCLRTHNENASEHIFRSHHRRRLLPMLKRKCGMSIICLCRCGIRSDRAKQAKARLKSSSGLNKMRWHCAVMALMLMGSMWVLARAQRNTKGWVSIVHTIRSPTMIIPTRRQRQQRQPPTTTTTSSSSDEKEHVSSSVRTKRHVDIINGRHLSARAH